MSYDTDAPTDPRTGGKMDYAQCAQRIAELEAALRLTRDLVQDAIQNGYDPGMGEWHRPLQENQEAICAILRKPT